MGLNEYCLQAMVNERIEAMRADMRAAALRAALRGPRKPLRVVLGHLLVRVGTRLSAGVTPARATA
jgi:hypothetical protein